MPIMRIGIASKSVFFCCGNPLCDFRAVKNIPSKAESPVHFNYNRSFLINSIRLWANFGQTLGKPWEKPESIHADEDALQGLHVF
jgi:hypothetical protein